MSDYSELKRLAEAARSDNSGYGDADCYEPKFGLTVVETAFASAATPAAVLALIAENERLAEEVEVDNKIIAERDRLLAAIPECAAHGQCVPYAIQWVKDIKAERDQLKAENERIKARLCACRDCAGQGEVYSGHDSYQSHFQPPEPDMDMCGTCGGDGVLGPLEDFEVLAAERDQLKAESEALRGAMLAVSIVVDGDIRATVRDCVNGLPDAQDIYGYCDNVDAIILAAMSQGEQA